MAHKNNETPKQNENQTTGNLKMSKESYQALLNCYKAETETRLKRLRLIERMKNPYLK